MFRENLEAVLGEKLAVFRVDVNKSEIKFLLSRRCWVHPFCHVPPNPKKCYLIIASGMKCDECSYRIENENKAAKLYELYNSLMEKKVEKHYDFIKSIYWKSEIRLKILQQDNHTCVICEEKNANQVHHILDFSADEDLSPKNLVTTCNRCHTKLHPVFPIGMWRLGWPDLDKVKMELRSFYEKVREASTKNQNRFKAPLEHIMTHICLICPLSDECDIGKSTSEYISSTMKEYDHTSLVQNKYHVDELSEGMSHVTVEGKIAAIDEPKEVKTRYGKTLLVVATLRDGTGKTSLNLFGKQANMVVPGDFVRVENGYVVKYDGELTLNVPRKNGRIFVNPEYSIPFSLRKIGRKGKIVDGTCNICGNKFTYEYLGGRAKKWCEECCRKIATKASKIIISCLRCGSTFTYEYRGGPTRKYCDSCWKKKRSETAAKKEKIAKNVLELYSKGVRPYLIAERLGMERNALNYWLNKLFPNREKWKRP